MEDTEKHPSVPSNYVTLAQLKEKWLKEQQQKQKDIEDEKQVKKEREIENQEGHLRNQENQKDKRPKEQQQKQRQKQKQIEHEKQVKKEREIENQNRKQSENNHVSIADRRPLLRNRGNRLEKNRPRGDVERESKPVEAEIGAVMVVGESSSDRRESLGEWKKKRKKKWRKEKTRAQENLSKGTKILHPEGEIPVAVTEGNSGKEGMRGNGKSVELNGNGRENEPEGKKIPVAVTEANFGKEGIRGNGKNVELNGSGRENEPGGREIPVVVTERKEIRRNGRNRGGNGKVWGKKSLVDRSDNVKMKFEDLSVNEGKIGNEKSVVENYGGDWKFNNGFRKLNRQNQRNVRDGNLVWVKKGEISDDVVTTDANRIGSSDSLAKVKARTRFN